MLVKNALTVEEVLMRYDSHDLLMRMSKPTETIQSIATEIRSQLRVGEVISGDLEGALFQLQQDGPQTME